MSKYTSQDPEVTILNIDERVNYECDLLKHNVDANTQAHTARMSLSFLSNPSGIVDSFRHPKDLPNTILLILFLSVFLCIIIMLNL